MSLKAKIEAVIYASEEPVTLVQLAGLLGHEAQAELDHLQAAQQSLPLDVESAAVSPLPEADIEGVLPASATSEPAEPELAAPAPVLSKPAPTDSAPTSEPDPTEASPIPEHPAALPDLPDLPDPTAAQSVPDQSPAALKAEERNRERKLREYFRSILDELIADYATSERGLEIREVAGGYRLATKPEYHDAVRGFVRLLKPPLKLSLQALETLAVIAYKQPVTAPEISQIRSVDSNGVLGSLLARKLITTAGRKQVIGRPILYKTTRDFLLRFGLKDLSELPSIEEFEKMAGELADIEPAHTQQEIPMHTADKADASAGKLEGRQLEEELASIERPESDTTEPEADGTPIPLEGSDESSAGAPGSTVATPEGDNEFAPDQPLKPIDDGHQKPPAIDTNKL